jgi:hypothetical protein
MLGFDYLRLANSNEEEEELRRSCSKNESDVSNCTCFPLERGARAGLFLGGAQESYYNALDAPNHQPC